MNDHALSGFASPDHAGSWMAAQEPDHDVIVTSRIRLARNVRGFPFRVRQESNDSERLEQHLRDCLKEPLSGQSQSYINLEECSALERELLRERQLVSYELARGTGPRGVFFSPADHFSVMVNEEDHLRLQILAPGEQLERLLERIRQVDSSIGEHVEYATHPRFGYLTSCPTNVGTGLRLSVMLHLPALVFSKEIEKVFNSAAKMKLAVRGFYGEGTSSYIGDFFQVSNQITLGKATGQLLTDLVKVIPKLVELERDVRRVIQRDHSQELEDKVFRAYGILSHARRISSQEALELLSQLRLGVCYELFTGVDLKTINELLVLTQPAHVQLIEHRDLSEQERDTVRADFIRSRLAGEPDSGD
jgi:protein arginine kinase